LSRKEFEEVQVLLRRENFFSLPPEMGALVADSPQAFLEVSDGKRKHEVQLFKLSEEFSKILVERCRG